MPKQDRRPDPARSPLALACVVGVALLITWAVSDGAAALSVFQSSPPPQPFSTETPTATTGPAQLTATSTATATATATPTIPGVPSPTATPTLPVVTVTATATATFPSAVFATPTPTFDFFATPTAEIPGIFATATATLEGPQPPLPGETPLAPPTQMMPSVPTPSGPTPAPGFLEAPTLTAPDVGVLAFPGPAVRPGPAEEEALPEPAPQDPAVAVIDNAVRTFGYIWLCCGAGLLAVAGAAFVYFVRRYGSR
jgi:type VI secretion system secreted protein VgrG